MGSTKPGPRRWYFKYGRCTHAELVRFLKDRTGTTFDMKTNRARLLSRLRELDRNATFPQFMEPPPELRLRVYEHLLAPDKELREMPGAQPPCPKAKIQTAVLRTSKAIYHEAEPVLYKANRFDAVLECVARASKPTSYKLKVERPGSKIIFRDSSKSRGYDWVLRRSNMRSFSSMFRGIRRLTIKVYLGQTPRDAHTASKLITRLCLLLCGDSKLEEMVFSLQRPDKSSSVAISTLPHIFWPTILLRSVVVVRFEGVAGVIVPQQPDNGRRESQRALLLPGTAEEMCRLVAKIRRGCEAARIAAQAEMPLNPGKNKNCLRWSRPTEVALMLERLAPLALIVDTVDVANGSPRLNMLQELADAETEMLQMLAS
jgi:hypothetical protein